MKIRKFNESEFQMTWEEYNSIIDEYIESLKDNLVGISDDYEIDIDRIGPELRAQYKKFDFDVTIHVNVKAIPEEIKGIKELESYSNILKDQSDIMISVVEGLNRSNHQVIDLHGEIEKGTTNHASWGDNPGIIKIKVKILDGTDHLFSHSDIYGD